MSYINANNIQLYYEIQGAGEHVLFIHGLGGSTKDWEYQIPFFSQYFQTITFDLRGHGKTEKPDHLYSISSFAADAAQLISALSQKSVHVVGHSLGGMIAFQLALDFPELVKSLTILNSTPTTSFGNVFAAVRIFLRKISIRLFGMRRMSHKLAYRLYPKPEQVELRENLIQRWCQNDPQAYLNSLAAFANWTVMDRLSDLQCNTLIVASDHDYTPILFKEFYTKRIPKAELVIIKNSYHNSMADQAQKFNSVLLDFLQRNL